MSYSPPQEKCSVTTMFGIQIMNAFKLDRKKSDKLGFQIDCGLHIASGFQRN
jgi:hypothetical protein